MNEKMLNKFRNRLDKLDQEKRDQDYQRSLWCREFRTEFPPGKRGDQEFLEVLCDDLGRTRPQAQEMLVRAQIMCAIPNEHTWNSLNGFRNIRLMVHLSLREQTQVVQDAVTNHKAVRTVLREMGYLEPIKAQGPRYAEILANYVATLRRTLPADVKEAMTRVLAHVRPQHVITASPPRVNGTHSNGVTAASRIYLGN